MAGLDSVGTTVIVMLENRSFDHMLGYLSLIEPKMNIIGLTAPVGSNVDYRLPGSKLLNSDYLSVSSADGELHYPYHMPDGPLATDLPHDRDSVKQQLGEQVPPYPMSGFVDAYYNLTPTRMELVDPLGFFTAAEVPMMDFFAREFALCDHWFASVPADTHPNRLMSLSGETLIDRTGGLLPDQPLVLDWLNQNRIEWRVYSDDLSFFALFSRLWPEILLNSNRFRKFSALTADVLNADARTFPKVVFIEPSFVDSPIHPDHEPNDDHPPLPVGFGQDFYRQIYQALTPPKNLMVWKQMIMMVMYDEHGGFYDHVSPLSPVTTNCGPGNNPFTSTGMRVPVFVVSPFVSPGQVYSRNLDHTSVLEFLADWLTPGMPYSATVDSRLQQPGFNTPPGRGRLSEILDRLQNPRSVPPNEPTVVIQGLRAVPGPCRTGFFSHI
jgi:phospholipase C